MEVAGTEGAAEAAAYVSVQAGDRVRRASSTSCGKRRGPLEVPPGMILEVKGSWPYYFTKAKRDLSWPLCVGEDH